jgi:hypothetical protein
MRATGIAARGGGGFGRRVGAPVFVGSWEQMARLIRFGVFLIAAVEATRRGATERERPPTPTPA